MDAQLLFRSKQVAATFIIEIVIWILPVPLADSSKSFKYRLFCGKTDGTCLVRYDNEKGKGDHRHILGIEYAYDFKDLRSLLQDFKNDVEKILMRGGGHAGGL
jgi:hypothetical protein